MTTPNMCDLAAQSLPDMANLLHVLREILCASYANAFGRVRGGPQPADISGTGDLGIRQGSCSTG